MRVLDNPNQERAVIALLRSPTIKGAAQEAGVSEATIHRWLEEEEFQAAYREARREALDHATARLAALAELAVAVLTRLASDGNVSPHARLSAAKTILEIAYRAREVEDLEERVRALEARL